MHTIITNSGVNFLDRTETELEITGLTTRVAFSDIQDLSFLQKLTIGPLLEELHLPRPYLESIRLDPDNRHFTLEDGILRDRNTNKIIAIEGSEESFEERLLKEPQLSDQFLYGSVLMEKHSQCFATMRLDYLYIGKNVEVIEYRSLGYFQSMIVSSKNETFRVFLNEEYHLQMLINRKKKSLLYTNRYPFYVIDYPIEIIEHDALPLERVISPDFLIRKPEISQFNPEKGFFSAIREIHAGNAFDCMESQKSDYLSHPFDLERYHLGYYCSPFIIPERITRFDQPKIFHMTLIINESKSVLHGVMFSSSETLPLLWEETFDEENYKKALTQDYECHLDVVIGMILHCKECIRLLTELIDYVSFSNRALNRIEEILRIVKRSDLELEQAILTKKMQNQEANDLSLEDKEEELYAHFQLRKKDDLYLLEAPFSNVEGTNLTKDYLTKMNCNYSKMRTQEPTELLHPILGFDILNRMLRNSYEFYQEGYFSIDIKNPTFVDQMIELDPKQLRAEFPWFFPEDELRMDKLFIRKEDFPCDVPFSMAKLFLYLSFYIGDRKPYLRNKKIADGVFWNWNRTGIYHKELTLNFESSNLLKIGSDRSPSVLFKLVQKYDPSIYYEEPEEIWYYIGEGFSAKICKYKDVVRLNEIEFFKRD